MTYRLCPYAECCCSCGDTEAALCLAKLSPDEQRRHAGRDRWLREALAAEVPPERVEIEFGRVMQEVARRTAAKRARAAN